MKKWIKRVALVLGAVVLLGGGFVVYQIGPSNIIGMMRYDTRAEGSLQVGHAAPDVALTALDGTTQVRLRERMGTKPTVLVFGSFT